MTSIEAYIIAYLGKSLDVPVSGDVPKMGTSGRLVTVEKTGSAYANHIDWATVVVQSWAESRAEADKLNETVKAAMLRLAVQPEICHCKLSTDYNYPELSTKTPRYQAVFEIIYYK